MSTPLRRVQPPPGLRPLLSHFPSPPSHIPASPVVSSPAFRTPLSPFFPNDPPPSGPPTAPLPPLPEGPSRVTQEDQIAFITMRRSSYASSSSRQSSRSHAHSRESSKSTSGDDESVAVSPSVSAVVSRATRGHGASGSVASTASTRSSGHDERGGARTRTPSPRTALGPQTPAPVPQTPGPAPTRAVPTVPPPPPPPPPPPAERDNGAERAASPDIAVLIQRAHTHTPRASTPGARPARRSRSSHSSGRRSAPGIKRLRSSPALGLGQGAGECAAADCDDDRDDDDGDTWDGASVADDGWDEIWDDAAVEDSDDDVIDLRTPLPHLMLRAGLLSPHSKLLPRPAPSPEPVPRPPPPAVAPAPAPAPAPALPRDARDTLKRRERHKDGRLLRGGIGLTTGLGWSDSEDEDAPSALTHRLSRLAPTLSRKSSMASSLASSARSPSVSSRSAAAPTLSRSTSSSTLSRSASSGTLAREPAAVLPYLATHDLDKADAPAAYPYSFPPATPTDPAHDAHALHVTGPPIWHAPRSPLFDDVDPFARQCRYDDRSPTPTNAPPASLSLPATPHARTLPPRPRPPSKALPPLPTAASGIPKTASMSSLRSVSGAGSALRQRARTPSNASASSVAAAVRARPALPAAAAAAARPRTASTSSAGSMRPLKPAIKPASASGAYARGAAGGGAAPRSRLAGPPVVATGIAI